MAITVAETIRIITKVHLEENNGLCLGQCLTAVGWVGGTVPEISNNKNLIELSMADVAGGGIVVGAALSGRKPIYIVRYQGFLWYNIPSIVNYAAKSKELWGVPCPLFLRAIAMEGSIGPVAGSSHYALAYRMPGIVLVSPMTPKEYNICWSTFLKEDSPYFVSEHRGSYPINYETPTIIHENADLTVLCLSVTRFNLLKAIQLLDLKINFIPVMWIKPFKQIEECAVALKNSKFGGLILDDDYEDGISKNIAFDLMNITNKTISVLGLKNKSAGFSKETDNLPPSVEEIKNKIKTLCKI